MNGWKWEIDCTLESVKEIKSNTTIEIMQRAEDLAIARSKIDGFRPCVTSQDMRKAEAGTQ